MLINLIPHMTYFMTTLHLMEVSVLTKINFFGLEKFLVLFIASTLPLHADRCDVLHALLQHCFTLHGHVRSHQDQLLVVGELYISYIASTLPIHTVHFDVLHDLLQLCHMYLMTMSVTTKINFLGLENLNKWPIYFTCALHDVCFDAP